MAGIKYLLDTNVVSVPLAARPSAGVLAGIAANAAQLVISAISWQEMLFGVERLPPGARRERILAYLEDRVRPTLPILSFDAAAGEWQARERARLSRVGLTPTYADTQIAAIAAVNGLILVTRNAPDFVQLADLMVKNWFDRPATARP